MKTKSIFGIVLTGVMCLCLIGCQNDDFMEKTNPLRTAQKGVAADGTWSLAFEATISDVADTRVVKLEKDDSNNDVLNGYWKKDETIGVYDGVNKLGFMTVTEVSTDGKNAKIEGSGLNLPNGTNMTLTLIYPDNADNDGNNAWYYTGQNGTINAISSTYDYMLSSLDIERDFNNNVTYPETPLTFVSQQSIYRFGFKDSDNGNADINVKQFTISSAKDKIVKQRNYETSDWVSTYGPLTVKPGEATTNLLYVAINNELAGTEGEDTYQFSAIGSDNNALYMGTKEIGASFFEKKSQFNSFKNVAMTQAKLATSTSTTNAAW